MYCFNWVNIQWNIKLDGWSCASDNWMKGKNWMKRETRILSISLWLPPIPSPPLFLISQIPRRSPLLIFYISTSSFMYIVTFSNTYKNTMFSLQAWKYLKKSTPNQYFLKKQPHLANKSCVKWSPYKTCARKLPFFKRKKPASSVNFYFHLKSHSDVNYNSNILICIKQL